MIAKKENFGLTLIEILVSLAVVGILIAVAMPALGDMLERRRVIAATSEVSGVLAYARSESNVTDSQLIVWFSPDPDDTMSCVAVTTDKPINNCECWKPEGNICSGGSAKLLRLFQLSKSTNVSFKTSASDWAGSSNKLKFSRIQFSVAVRDFQVNIKGTRGSALRIEVNEAGRVRTCSPNGDMSGYPRCGEAPT